MASPCLTRRVFLSGALGSSAALISANSRGASPLERGRPNIVYIMSDQQHWQALGHVDSFFQTPHLDAFAEDAATFDRAFCTTPQCSPSRSSMMTGLYPTKTQVMGNVGAAGGDELATPNLGAMLQQADYQTAYFGKWHLGRNPVGYVGWDTENRKLRDPDVTDKAVEYLNGVQATKSPFGLVVSYLDPHDVYHFRPDKNPRQNANTPLSASWEREDLDQKPKCQKEFMTKDQGRMISGQDREVWQAYHEFYREKVRLVDEHIGRVLEAIKAAGLWDNTIIVIGSDHGDMDTNHRLIFKGPFMYEHMVRVPLMVRVPRKFGGIRRGPIRDYDTVNVDLVPTIRDFAGLDPIDTNGISLKPILTGVADPPKRDFVIGQYYSKQQWVNPIRMIRTAEFKYNKYIDHGEELYDLVNDPEELVNLAGDARYADTQRALATDLDRWIRENDDPFYSMKTTKLKKGYGWPNRPKANRS